MTVDIAQIRHEIEIEANNKKRIPLPASLNSQKQTKPLSIYRAPRGSIKQVLGFKAKSFVARIYSHQIIGRPLQIARRLVQSLRSIRQLEHQNEIISRKLAFLHSKINQLEGTHEQYLYMLIDQQKNLEKTRMNLLDENQHTHQKESFPTSHQQNAEKSPSRSLEEFYLAFENAHRGSSELIEQRQSAYLDYIAPLKSKPALDIGCGRGEWLEMLESNGYSCIGVDLDDRMVDTCRTKNLNAIKADAISYLEQQEDHSLAFITAFHVVEHISPTELIELLRICHQKIMIGGIIILETPNPENLIVGACNFYHDITHIRPIPPITLQFMLSFSGFKKTDCLRLHPAEDRPKTTDPTIHNILDRLYGPEDYALIGYKEQD